MSTEQYSVTDSEDREWEGLGLLGEFADPITTRRLEALGIKPESTDGQGWTA